MFFIFQLEMPFRLSRHPPWNILCTILPRKITKLFPYVGLFLIVFAVETSLLRMLRKTPTKTDDSLPEILSTTLPGDIPTVGPGILRQVSKTTPWDLKKRRLDFLRRFTTLPYAMKIKQRRKTALRGQLKNGTIVSTGRIRWFNITVRHFTVNRIHKTHENETTVPMMTSSNGHIFRVTIPLWGESTGHRWIRNG